MAFEASALSVVNAVLLRPLPFTEPERLVGVYHRSEALGLAVMNQGPATYFTYRDHQRVFEEIGAWESNEVSITGRGELSSAPNSPAVSLPFTFALTTDGSFAAAARVRNAVASL